MSCKPFIGLNADFRAAKQDTPAYSYLSAGYYDSIVAAGGIPVVVPPLTEEDDLQCVLDQLQGFVLIGGYDLDPRRDGFMLHPTVRTLDSRRESFDRMLMRLVAQRRMPVFGIGVGMQLMNVAMGGNLFLHLAEDLPDSIPHKDPQDPGHRHGREIRVNSRHHMGIDEVAPGFAVTARCPDGVIEAIESRMDDWFAIGTQFHPEADSASALDQRIFEEFVDGARMHAHARDLRIVA